MSLLLRVCVALLRGQTVRTQHFEARAFIGPNKRLRFGCFSLEGVGAPLWSPESATVVSSIAPRHLDRRGFGAVFSTDEQQDWSAFGAAAALFSAAGSKDVAAALRLLDNQGNQVNQAKKKGC